MFLNTAIKVNQKFNNHIHQLCCSVYQVKQWAWQITVKRTQDTVYKQITLTHTHTHSRTQLSF